MKKIYQVALLSLSFLIVASCDDGFDELNKSKTGATSVDPISVFNNAVVFCSPPAGTLVYELGAVQQIITSNSGVNVGANYNQVNIGSTPANWTNTFQNTIKYCADVISYTKDDPTRANLYNMARIIQQYGFMVLTDTYGPIPYSEAGKGVTDQLFLPAYDTPEAVYDGIISELTAAAAALDPAGKIETSDVLYKGDIAKWKKFGYSLLLRAGMRLVNANAAKAATTVAAAFNGGVILDNADNAVIRHDANFMNGVGNTLNGTEAANFYLAKPFVDALKANNDPRLTALAVRYVGANSGPAQIYTGTGANSTFLPANQYGMPMGSTDATADASGATLPGGGNRYAHSQADRTRVVSRASPMYLATAGMSNLLLAEAVERGIAGVTGTSAAYFAAGITAHMVQMSGYGTASTVPAGDITTYVTARAATFLAAPAGAALADSRVNEINYEYWVASFLNGNECWANFRRVGMEQRSYRTPNPAAAAPLFLANPYSGKVVDWINRITYPPSESLVNTDNYNAAVQSMGGKDELGVKLFWAQ
ncbi:SusD/RagB family nutrient-binding outer membrane lipoprotein [Chryseolinea sp. T2]|uniref:SusD/RagB family nutrient-binding outer membrane lipoprotein n=1 Tax=Chryseolinea sp. T2 TaxID=3129255 RepID=UPI0030782C9C